MTAVSVVPGGQRYTRWSRQDSSDINTDDEGATIRRLTPLERLNLDMCQDERVVRELTLGRRIGFYKIRGEIGCGNFSHVKLGIHALTKAEREPNTSLNNAYGCTIRYLNTILPLKNFSVFSYLRSI
uniref:NIM1 serine/threonine protein kinase n=1 Tax=Sander lucioperca TaxID=283035 RepID=A0A8C9WYR3_SANLU